MLGFICVPQLGKGWSLPSPSKSFCLIQLAMFAQPIKDNKKKLSRRLLGLSTSESGFDRGLRSYFYYTEIKNNTGTIWVYLLGTTSALSFGDYLQSL